MGKNKNFCGGFDKIRKLYTMGVCRESDERILWREIFWLKKIPLPGDFLFPPSKCKEFKTLKLDEWKRKLFHNADIMKEK